MERGSSPDAVNETHGVRTDGDLTIKILITLSVLVIGIALMAISQLDTVKKFNWETPMAQIGLGLVITAVTFLLINQQLERGNREYTGEVIKQAEQNIGALLTKVQESLEGLAKQNQILSGAIARDIEQIYAKREDGLRDLMEDIRHSKHVRMLGISHREYFIAAGHHYRDMEELLDNIIKSKDRTLQVLLINPYGEQATIRAERESEHPFSDTNRYEESTLYGDVIQSMRYLDRWEHDSGHDNKVTSEIKTGTGSDDLKHVEAKVYNSSPTCFMVITDTHTYIEQYLYGLPKSGLLGGNFPLLKFQTLASAHGSQSDVSTTSVARHLSGHFDYVWNHHGTQPLRHLLQDHNIGVSKSAWECRVANLFTNRTGAEERIEYLLSREKEEIRLIGISLRDFFHGGRRLNASIRNASKSARIKALMLDPFSEQGRFRSEREQPGVDPGNLFYEVNTSIGNIKGLGTGQVSAKLYRASPSCFAVLTGESVVIEQYHYGSADPSATILGGKVPVLEYSKGSAMYAEMEGHFDHIWNNLSIEIDEWRAGPSGATRQLQ